MKKPRIQNYETKETFLAPKSILPRATPTFSNLLYANAPVQKPTIPVERLDKSAKNLLNPGVSVPTAQPTTPLLVEKPQLPKSNELLTSSSHASTMTAQICAITDKVGCLTPNTSIKSEVIQIPNHTRNSGSPA